MIRGLETHNIITTKNNQFENRQLHFTNYLQEVSHRLRSGKSIIAIQKGINIKHSWRLTRDGIQIGLVQLESDRISIITDENLESDYVYTGQITDGNHQITTFTILNGVFQLTEHLTKQSIKIFMDSLKKADYSFDLCTYT